MELKQKAAIVTGGSKGIGRAIALALAKEGVRVGIAARTPEAVEETAAQIRACGVEAFPFVGNMAVEADIQAFVTGAAKAFGKLDILVNNAGIGKFHTIGEFPTSDWDDMFNLNVRGLFIATRESLPHLRKAGESIVVNVASIAGKNHFKHGGGYAATKHAVLGFSRCLMLEERDNGVRVLAICPGSVRTDFFDAHTDVSQERLDSMLHVDDVAESVIHMMRLPQRAMVSEIDIRPTNPK
ncbi:MAG: SDR family NAD(P)-dependent oxidoreductase [Candidatus Krumholzibacteria bacterium]